MSEISTPTGSIFECNKESTFIWKIKNFINVFDRKQSSPDFYFLGNIFRLDIIPIPLEDSSNDTEIFASIQIKMISNMSLDNVNLYLCLKNVRGKVHFQKLINNVNFNAKESRHEFKQFISKSGFAGRANVLEDNNKITQISLNLKSNDEITVKNEVFTDMRRILEELFNDVTHKQCSDITTVRVKDEDVTIHGFMKRVHPKLVDGAIEVDDNIMEEIFDFIYRNTIPSFNKNTIDKLYYVANKLELKPLKTSIEQFLRSEISKEYVCEILELCKTLTLPNLQKDAEEYFIQNWAEIRKQAHYATFKQDNQQLVLSLLERALHKNK